MIKLRPLFLLHLFHINNPPKTFYHVQIYALSGAPIYGDVFSILYFLTILSAIRLAAVGLPSCSSEMVILSSLRSDNFIYLTFFYIALRFTERSAAARKWRKIYTPQNQTERIHPLFVESLTRKEHIEYLSEVLTYGSDKELADPY